jgi:GMP synthase-like glutamine amidotransferase
MVNVFVEDEDFLVSNMLRKEFGWNILETPDEADVIVFTGGADVSPHLYDEDNVASGTSRRRDDACIHLFNTFDVPRIGICRGAQFLNVISGGRMWQDVDGHTRSHLVRDTRTLREYFCTSTHHQMMRPSPDAAVIGIAAAPLSTYRLAANELERFKSTDIEVLYYGDTKSLCFQPHPEYDGHPECTQYFTELVSEFFPQLLAEG